MIEIDARSIIFTLLLIQGKVKVEWIVPFVEAVSKEFNKTYFDISGDSLYGVVYEYADVLIEDDDGTIVVRDDYNFDRYFDSCFLDSTINSRLPEPLRECMYRCANEVNKDNS